MVSQNNKSIANMTSVSNSDKRKTLLFVDHDVPQYDLFAGSRTNFMYLELLAGMGLKIKFMAANFLRVEPYSSELNRLGIETLDGEWYRHNWKQWLKENGADIDYVFFHKPDPAYMFLPAVMSFTEAAIIYQCHDLHHLRLKRKAEVEGDPGILEEAAVYEQKENFIFANSDVLLTFSEVEEKFISERFPDKKVCTVPLFFYRKMQDTKRDFSQRKDLLFVGSCAHSPNRDALLWFCGEIFPLIRSQVPGICLNVIGADPPAEIATLHSDHIRILGRLTDTELGLHYGKARMMVVPLRFGAGVKGKVIEALYNGIPLVSTAVGLEGIKGIGQLATPSDTPAAFAAEVVSLYTDFQKLAELSERGAKFVVDNFTLEKTTELMSEILSTSTARAKDRFEANGAASPPRLIALYLPQYHPIPENDEWWGEGFTEWRNVSKATPLFPGHYQPHVPADLGYYDLRDQATQIAQADLARKYGIEGFCYYHYWFNGHRLLEHPLAEVLKSGKPDFPFCICWANENWTRRWDGEDQQVLMHQEYSEEDDRAHIRSLLPVFEDKRYIRVNGKPLFLVYRTENIPDPARTADIWREEARKAGIGELYLCRVESITKSDPHAINFDAGLEFAPDWWNKGPQLKADPKLFSQDKGSPGEICNDNWIHSYQDLADAMMAKQRPPYRWYRCVTPSWDNWARRRDGANIFLGSTPDKYKNWLSFAIDQTVKHHSGDERLVFVNAWNEWAEGNHLEPDQKFGHGYLEATRRALEESQLAADASRPGASEAVRLGQYLNRLVNRPPAPQSPADNSAELGRLERKLAERDLQIEELLSSTSWRVTKILRWIKRRVSGELRKNSK